VNSVGDDWPRELRFTDNGRDNLNDVPPDELNHAPGGMDFGFLRHGGDVADRSSAQSLVQSPLPLTRRASPCPACAFTPGARFQRNTAAPSSSPSTVWNRDPKSGHRVTVVS
jgi:glucose/arabinose dehydrogenase